MRTRVVLLTAALLMIVRAGAAQTPQAPRTPPPPAGQPALTGSIDVGGLFTTTDGDAARFERYRDMRDGLYSTFALGRLGSSYAFDANAFHVGYRDQFYNATLNSRRVNASFNWRSIPLNFSDLTRTPFSANGSTLTLPDDAQRAVEGPTNAPADGTAVGVPCAPGAPPASCSTPALAAQAKANRSIYEMLASPFDLRYRRDTAAASVNYAPTRDIDVDAQFLSTMRDGEQPWGASFSFNNAVEIPKPLDETTNNMTLGASWAKPRGMFRLGWDGSWFNNRFDSLVWDNPIRITDFTNGLPPPNGPYDPNGYSNGNGPVQGRMSVAPDNQMHVVSATGLYKMAGRTSINGALQLTSQTQDDPLIPWTINSVINTPGVFAAFPHLTGLPRATAQAEAKGLNSLLNFSSRPNRLVNFAVRYRFNKRDVRTPLFDATEYVRFDAVPEEIEEGFSPQFDTSRHIFDANTMFTPSAWGTLRVGYGYEAIERTGRGFSNTHENIFRASWDTYSNQYVTLRASVDVGVRRGEGFVEAHAISETEDLTLITGPGGTQPTLRYFDEADRDRTRGSILFTVMPRDTVDLYAQFTAGKEKYRADDFARVSRPGELFGLLESNTGAFNVGADFHPSDVVSVGGNYGRDNYGSFQRSRNANPPPDPTWTDPSRDWTLDNDDRVNTISVYLNLVRAIRDTDVRLGYDYSDSNNSFTYGGPRIVALASLGQFIPLPDVDNAWHRLNADVQYFFTARAGIGAGYYFEKLDVEDFNTIDTGGPVGFAPETGDPRLDWLGGLTLGYGNRPYTGNTGYVRFLYRF